MLSHFKWFFKKNLFLLRLARIDSVVCHWGLTDSYIFSGVCGGKVAGSPNSAASTSPLRKLELLVVSMCQSQGSSDCLCWVSLSWTNHGCQREGGQ